MRKSTQYFVADVTDVGKQIVAAPSIWVAYDSLCKQYGRENVGDPVSCSKAEYEAAKDAVHAV